MRAGKAPPSPWYFSIPQGYPGPGIVSAPGMPYHGGATVRLGATPSPGFTLAVAVTAGIALATMFTLLVKAS